MKNKIGWCSMTWNPVWGCLNHCEYCYAKKIAKRFWAHTYIDEVNHQIKLHPNWAWTGDHLNGLKEFKPTFLDAQFAKEFPKKLQRIFVGSMSEIYYWNEEWLEKVLEKVKLYPQHTFQFLTKHPEIYFRYIFPKNFWLGTTITKRKDIDNYFLDYLWNTEIKSFLSFEPLMGNIKANRNFLKNSNLFWVIIGAESGNRKGKVIPKREWIDEIVIYCRKNNIPIYLKDSLKDIYPVEMKEFPKIEL